jgi:predicted ribosome quality control (RQC) complex YloA/Tae2 family protein
VSVDGYAALREVIAGRVATARRKLQRQIEGLNADEPEPGAAEQLRRAAEWLLALSSRIAPGQRTLEVDAGEGELLRIALEEGVPPVEQAQAMFRRAAKMERAGPAIRARRAKLEGDLAYVEQLDCDLSLATSQPEIAAVEDELRRAGLVSEPGEARRKPTPRGPLPGVLRFVSPDGFEVLVGRNARQNEAVTFDLARNDDAWLHARGTPGAHVVVRAAGRTISEEALRFAAQLAGYYSRLRGERAAQVMVTRRRFVGRVPGGRPGQVTVDRAETMTVAAVEPQGIEVKSRS